MMYKSKAQARDVLARISPQSMRAYLIEGETLSPAEEWLIWELIKFLPVKRKDYARKEKRWLIGLAKSLDLYPVPEWWIVRERLSGRLKFEFRDEYGNPVEGDFRRALRDRKIISRA